MSRGASPSQAGETSLAEYVLAHYPHLMTPHERAVVRHLTALYKDRGKPPEPGTADEIPPFPLERWTSADPAVRADAQAGWEEARGRIAERIVRDHAGEAYLNRCPHCAALTRTPRARLCLVCGHTWFHVPRDVRL